MKKKFYKSVLIFTPIFITANGLYQGEISETGLHLGETGFVFPLLMFFGLLFLMLIFFNILYKQKSIFYNKYFVLIIFSVFFYTLTTALIGFIEYGEIIILLRWFQFMSLVFGIIIFYYFFYIKKININLFLRSIFFFLMILIPVHYLSSFLELGVVNSLSSISPNIFFFGIYQSRVYYPYLIVTLFFLSILAIKSNILRNSGILLLLVYIFSLQVRGALLSLIIYVLLYFILIYRRKVLGVLILAIIAIFIFQSTNFIQQLDLGRFGRFEAIYTVGGRIPIWLDSLKTDNVFQFIFGNLFFDQDQFSAHNQYIHFYNYGGIVLLLLFSLTTLPFINNLLLQIKQRDFEKIFLLTLFFVPLIVDLNINVPLNNVNSGIIYLFIWSIVFYLTRPINKK